MSGLGRARLLLCRRESAGRSRVLGVLRLLLVVELGRALVGRGRADVLELVEGDAADADF